MSRDLVAGLLLGAAGGALVAWYVSRAVERFRRARRDFAAAKSGIGTLVEMMVRRGVAAVGWTLAGVLVLVLVGAVMIGGRP